MISFVVPGFPRGKGRARSFGKQLKSGKIITGQYPDDKTVVYEALVRQTFCNKYPNFTPIEGAVLLTVRAYFPIPKSARKKEIPDMLVGNIRPTRRPDFSNIEKAIEDGMNSVAFADDALIVGHGFPDGKYFTDGQPRVEVEITEWKPFV